MSASARGFSAVLLKQILWLAIAFTAGACLNFAFAPFGEWPLAVLAPATLFALINGLPSRRAGWMGAAFGVGLFGFGTYWLYTCLHVFGLVPIWLTLVLQAALIGLMTTYYAALCYLANRFWLKSNVIRTWLVLPALWVLLEWLRGWAWTGFPWLSLGYALIDSPLKGWAPVFGVYGVTWVAALLAAALNFLLIPGLSISRRCIALGGMSLLFLIPSVLNKHDWTRAVGASIPIAAVQGAVPQDQKWQAKNLEDTMVRYSRLTIEAWGARLIVWPESALPITADEIREYLQRLQQEGRAHGADFAIGLVNYEPATHRFYNGLLVLSDSGGGWYFKRHLVPFGEYFPVPSFVRSWMRLLSLPYEQITAGDDHQPNLSAAGQKLGLTICYEDAFGSQQLKILRDATLLVNVTNNAWYGDSTAPHQHLQIARMRASEAGRYLVRSANDGITAVIGPKGDIVARLPQFQEAVLHAAVQPMTGLTPYARVGNYPIVIGASLLLMLAAWRRWQGMS